MIKKIIYITLIIWGIIVVSACGRSKGEFENIDGSVVVPENENSEADETAEEVADMFSDIKTDIDVDFSGIENFSKIYPFGVGFYIDGQSISFAESKFSSLIEDGTWKTDVDMKQIISSCEVTDEIKLEWGDDSSLLRVYVKVVNVYDEDVSLGECRVASIRIGSDNESVTDGWGMPFVTTKKEDLYEKYANEYLSEINESTICIDNIENSYISLPEFGTGLTEIIHLGSNKAKETYYFNDGLYEILIEVPNLLYGGIAENVDNQKKQQLNENDKVYAGVAKQKTSLIDELKNRFNEEGVDIEINESDGEVTLPSEILFETDEYELNDNGKEYIDKVLSIYGDIILDEKFNDLIDSLVIEGHTDTNGTYDYNLELSQKRSDSVREYMLNSNNNGLSENQKSEMNGMTKSIGRSYDEPVISQFGEIDMDASRRVTISFMVKI